MSEKNPPSPAEAAKRQRIQQELDDALADSFPASDPVSIVTSQHEEAWDDAPETGKDDLKKP
jgi:hypothetical protein